MDSRDDGGGGGAVVAVAVAVAVAAAAAAAAAGRARVRFLFGVRKGDAMSFSPSVVVGVTVVTRHLRQRRRLNHVYGPGLPGGRLEERVECPAQILPREGCEETGERREREREGKNDRTRRERATRRPFSSFVHLARTSRPTWPGSARARIQTAGRGRSPSMPNIGPVGCSLDPSTMVVSTVLHLSLSLHLEPCHFRD